MKIGIEVEGRYKGIKTLFCSALEYLMEPLPDLMRVSHIYISDHENALDITNENVFYEIPESHLITVERTEVGKKPCDRIHVILNVPSDSFWNLRETDQVKFDLNQTVYAVPLEVMYKTKPEDFAGDTTL
jgi:hypothetical protein